ncbi:hypothetical protein JCM3770_006472 [Rhodotorula araucariae]
MAERRPASTDRLNPKRRRLASPSPSPPLVPGPPSATAQDPLDSLLQPPTHRIGFHRSLQEASLRRVIGHRLDLSAADDTIRKAEHCIQDVRRRHLEHAEHIRDHLNAFTTTLQRANTLTADSRRLGRESATIGNDVSTLTARFGDWLPREIYKKQALGEARGVLLLTHDEDAKLAHMTDDILGSELFQGLLASIELPATSDRDPHEEWEEVLAAFNRVEDAHPIGENWSSIFELYDMDSEHGFDALSPANSDHNEWPLLEEWYVGTARCDYAPRSEDELLVEAGDRILLRKRYPDLWGLGSVVSNDWTSLRTGFFPVACLDVFARMTYSTDSPERQAIADEFAQLLIKHVSERRASLSAPLDPAPPVLVDASARYRAFRGGVSALLRRIGTAQLSRLTEMNALLAELGQHAARARADHTANSELESALAGELAEWHGELSAAEQRRPKLQQRFEEEILTLVILSQGH